MGMSRRAWLQGAGAVAATGTTLAPFAALAQQTSVKPLIIDCHGHYTTEPEALNNFRAAQIAALKDPSQKPSIRSLNISDDQLRESVQPQLKFQRERGTAVTLFSPRAGGMGHHIGTAETSAEWSQVSNELIHRICALYPDNFIGVGQLPQSPGVRPDNCLGELERCVKSYGFVAVNLNPDPSGGYWRDPPLTDRWWYPLYEKLVELDIPAMIHVSASANPNFHGTGAHYIAADTTAFMQLLTSDLFKDFPTLRIIIPHGGGAVPYHWGRYRGLAQDMNIPPRSDLQSVSCLCPHCLQANFTRDTPFSADTRFGAPHLPQTASMRVLPCFTTMALRSIVSRISRSASSRIDCFDIRLHLSKTRDRISSTTFGSHF